MHNIFRRPGAQTWSVRFHVPRERQEDVGKALGVRSGRLAERVRTLRTTNRAEALGRRPAALEGIRQEIDAKLTQAGFPPLQGEWRPDWVVEQSDVVSEALEARRELEAVSDVPDQTEEMPNNRFFAPPRRIVIPKVARDRHKQAHHLVEVVEDTEPRPPGRSFTHLVRLDASE
jgi:hypothetical protein